MRRLFIRFICVMLVVGTTVSCDVLDEFLNSGDTSEEVEGDEEAGDNDEDGGEDEDGNIDTTPESGVTDDLEPTPERVIATRQALYAAFASKLDSYSLTINDLRSDLFHQLKVGVSAGLNDAYLWEMNSSNKIPEAVWESYFDIIEVTNKAVRFAERARENVPDHKIVDDLEGDALFLRAYCYYELARLFGRDFQGNESTPGIPIYQDNITHEQPRANLDETYAFVMEGLDKAMELITENGTDGHYLITKAAVAAMRARVCMAIGQYERAIDNIRAHIIDSGLYTLTASEKEFEEMWAADSGRECIWVLHASPDLLPKYTYDIGYMDTKDGETYLPKYIPEKWVLDIFDKCPGDFRAEYHLREVEKQGGAVKIRVLSKFPGNPALSEDGTPRHMLKPIRLAEMYLLLAEAFYMTGRWEDARMYLNILRKARGCPDADLNEIFNEIQEERVRELVGEGFRLNDIARYSRNGGLYEMRRGEAQHEDYSCDGFIRGKDDPGFVLPIPSYELQLNPNMMQNEGYF